MAKTRKTKPSFEVPPPAAGAETTWVHREAGRPAAPPPPPAPAALTPELVGPPAAPGLPVAARTAKVVRDASARASHGAVRLGVMLVSLPFTAAVMIVLVPLALARRAVRARA